MPPPPDPSNNQIREIQRRLTLVMGVEGGELTERQIKAVLREYEKLGFASERGAKKSKELSGSLGKVGDSARKMRGEVGQIVGVIGALAVGMSNLANSGRLLSGVLGGGFLAIGARELDQYYKVLLATTSQFNKYGEGAYKVEQAAIRLGKEFGFTRDEAIALMTTIEQGFNFKPAREMTNYMRLLENAVGANDRAMASYSQRVAGLARQLPGLQEVLRTGIDADGFISKDDIARTRDFAAALTALGAMSRDDFKFALDFVADNQAARQGKLDKAAGFSNVDRERRDEANRALKAMQELERTVNEVALAAGETLRPILEKISDVVKSINPEFVNIAATVSIVGAGLVAALGTGMALVKGLSMMTKLAGGGIGLAGRLMGRGGLGSTGGLAGAAGGVFGKLAGGVVPVYVVNLPGSGFGGLGGLGGPGGVGGRAGRFGGLAGRGLLAGGATLLGGALVGALGGAVTDFITEQIGMTRAEEGGYAAGGLRAAGRIGAGFAAGGPLGAIGAGVYSIGSDAVEMVRVGKDIVALRSETMELTKAQADLAKKTLDEMRTKGRDELDIRIAEQAEQVRLADENRMSSQGLWAGWTGQKSRAEQNLREQQDKLQKLVAERNRRREISGPEGEKAMTEAKKKAEAERKVTEEQTRQAEKLMRITQQQENISMLLKLQQNLVSATNSLFDAQLSVLTAAGATIGGSVSAATEAYLAYVNSLDKSNTLLASQIALVDQVAKTTQSIPGSTEQRAAALARINEAIASGDLDKMEATMREVAATAGGHAAIVSRLTELSAEQWQNEMRRVEAGNKLTTIYDQQFRSQQADVQLMETQIALADNLAMGVAASAEMRMRAIREISDVINTKRAEQAMLEGLIVEAQKRQAQFAEAAASGNKQAQRQLASARAEEFQRSVKYKENQTEILRLIQKQAEMTRVLRDGWVNAINAMNTGVGMFTKIKIDRETRVGTLMSRAPRPVVGLATGFAGAGRRESVSYSALGPGILANPDAAGGAFGAGSAEWARAIDKRTPLGFMGGMGGMGDLDQAAHGVGLWQELIGRNLSTEMAGAAAAPFGVGGLFEQADKLADKMAGGVRKGVTQALDGAHLIVTPNAEQAIRADSPIPVNIVGSSIIVPVQMKDVIARNKGGIIPGHGPNVDSVPVIATPGEGVLNRDAMRLIGRSGLDALNAGQVPEAMRAWQKAEQESLLAYANAKFRKAVTPAYDRLVQGGPERMEWSRKIDDLQAVFEEERKKIESASTFEEFSEIAKIIGAPSPSKPPQTDPLAIRPDQPVTPGLKKSLEELMQGRPDLAYKARHEAKIKVDHDIASRRAQESILVEQLQRTASKEQRRQIAAQRISNREQLRAAESERRLIERNIVTPSVADAFMRLKKQSDRAMAEFKTRQAASQAVPSGPSVTSPLGAKVPDVGDRWWDNPDKRAADGAPIAVLQPPTRETAPKLFAALDAATSIPSDYPAAAWIADDHADELKRIMEINDSGVRRNQEIKKFIAEKKQYLAWVAEQGIPSADERILHLQDKLAKAKGAKDGAPEEMFLSLEQTKKIEADLAEAMRVKKFEEMSKALVEKQVEFAEKAYMPLVDKYAEVKELQAYKAANSGRLPGQLPEGMNRWLESLQGWQRDVFANMRADLESEQSVRNVMEWMEIANPASPLFKEISASLASALSGKDIDQVKAEFKKANDWLVKDLAGSSADGLKGLNSQLLEQIAIIDKMLPRDDEGLRGAFYAQQIEDIANEAIPRNLTDQERVAFYQTIKGKALAIKNLVRGGDYKTYQGQVRPMVDEIHAISSEANQGFDEIKQKFDGLYSNIILSKDPSFGQYNLPQLARGGLIPQSPGGQPVIVGEGKYPEIVSPIPTLERVVKEAFQSVISEERQRAVESAQTAIAPIMDSVDRSIGRVSDGDSFFSPSPPSGSVKITLSEAQMAQVKDALVREFENSFRGVAEAAMSRVMDELNNGV